MDRFRDIDPGMPTQGGGGGRGNFPPRRGFGSAGGNAAGDGNSEAFGGRIPPQNIEAEMAILGAMMLGERGSVERASELIQREDFYREAHALIYDSMLSLTEKDEPVDIVTLKDELGRRGVLDAIGGIGYLMQLGEFVPTTANLSYHAQIVREKAILRRLIEAASRIAGMAYGEVDEVDQVVDMAERTIFEVARKRSAQGFMPLRPLLNEAFDQVDIAYQEKGMVTGIDTGFEDLNYMTSGLQDGDLIILAARPSMGKTSLAVGIGQNVALQKEHKSVAIFSLEMSREQLVQRMICSEARVDAHKLRTGFLQDDDWDRLANAIQRLWDANIYIDDTTDMGPLEMRAKCRRLRAEHGLDLVIVDYLQLMRGSGKSNANRNEEITEISRGLKNIAREMRVPVIALAQLSRAVERREDKRPMLSDLRDCLTGDARLYCADTGRMLPIAEVRPGNRILSVNPRTQKVVAATVADWWDKGVQTVYRITTETGRVLECTANHPFLTADGYKPLQELTPDTLIAAPLTLLQSGPEVPERGDECRLLGYMAGDGHYGKHRTLSFISADKDVYEDAKAIVAKRFPTITCMESVTPSKTPCYEVDFVCHHKDGKHGKPFGNPFINWLREQGILGQLCDTKRVASFVFEAGLVGAQEFLAGYMATDGCVKKMRGRWFIHFDTVSHELARDVQHLLLRLGVITTVQNPTRKESTVRPIYRININPIDANLRRFAEQIHPIGRKGVLLQELLQEQPRVATNPGVFALPAKLSSLLFERTKHLRQQGRKLANGKRQYWKDQGTSLRRDTCRVWADQLNDSELRMWADSDLLWERIRSVEAVGEKQTYDIRVPETGNFLAEGVVVHNSGSIEAEADLVSFIYRPAYYERKQEVSRDDDEGGDGGGQRPGEYEGEEAEVIIAKHRNGPTGTVKVAFLARFARFDNLANRDDNPF